MKFKSRTEYSHRLPNPRPEQREQLSYHIEPTQFEKNQVKFDFKFLPIRADGKPEEILNEIEVYSKVNGFSDSAYNYAIHPHEPGVWTLRGWANRVQKEKNRLVLLLMSERQQPTPSLIKTMEDLSNGLYEPIPPVGSYKTGDQNALVFDLIDFLSFQGFYEGPNLGVYTDAVGLAVERYQFEKGQPLNPKQYNG